MIKRIMTAILILSAAAMIIPGCGTTDKVLSGHKTGLSNTEVSEPYPVISIENQPSQTSFPENPETVIENTESGKAESTQPEIHIGNTAVHENTNAGHQPNINSLFMPGVYQLNEADAYPNLFLIYPTKRFEQYFIDSSRDVIVNISGEISDYAKNGEFTFQIVRTSYWKTDAFKSGDLETGSTEWYFSSFETKDVKSIQTTDKTLKIGDDTFQYVGEKNDEFLKESPYAGILAYHEKKAQQLLSNPTEKSMYNLYEAELYFETDQAMAEAAYYAASFYDSWNEELYYRAAQIMSQDYWIMFTGIGDGYFSNEDVFAYLGLLMNKDPSWRDKILADKAFDYLRTHCFQYYALMEYALSDEQVLSGILPLLHWDISEGGLMLADTGDVVFKPDNTFSLTEIQFMAMNPDDPESEWDYVHIGDSRGTWGIKDRLLTMNFDEAWRGIKTYQLQIKTDTNELSGDSLYLTTNPDFSP